MAPLAVGTGARSWRGEGGVAVGEAGVAPVGLAVAVMAHLAAGPIATPPPANAGLRFAAC